MIKGSDVRHPEHPVSSLFLDRWAPPSDNNPPWRIVYARMINAI